MVDIMMPYGLKIGNRVFSIYVRLLGPFLSADCKQE